VEELESVLNLINFLGDLTDYFSSKEEIYKSANCEMYIGNLNYIWGLPENHHDYKKFKDALNLKREQINSEALKDKTIESFNSFKDILKNL